MDRGGCAYAAMDRMRAHDPAHEVAHKQQAHLAPTSGSRPARYCSFPAAAKGLRCSALGAAAAKRSLEQKKGRGIGQNLEHERGLPVKRIQRRSYTPTQCRLRPCRPLPMPLLPAVLEMEGGASGRSMGGGARWMLPACEEEGRRSRAAHRRWPSAAAREIDFELDLKKKIGTRTYMMLAPLAWWRERPFQGQAVARVHGSGTPPSPRRGRDVEALGRGGGFVGRLLGSRWHALRRANSHHPQSSHDAVNAASSSIPSPCRRIGGLHRRQELLPPRASSSEESSGGGCRAWRRSRAPARSGYKCRRHGVRRRSTAGWEAAAGGLRGDAERRCSVKAEEWRASVTAGSAARRRRQMRRS